MTLRKQGTTAVRKDPCPGLGIEHLGGATRVATTLGKVRSNTMLEANGVASGVLTVSGEASYTNENLLAREAMLSQAASQLDRREFRKEDPMRRYAAGMRLGPGGAENSDSSIDAEIATLERLNQEDSQLCDDLRASCIIDTPNRNAKTGGGQPVTRNCWSLVQGALPKGSFSGSACPRVGDKGIKAGVGKIDGDRDGGDSSSAKKRVFSKYDEETTSILTEWFLSHKRWPYPAAKEKDALAEATNLTTLQISNWFTNKRKRHWTPVIKKRTRSPRDFFEFCVMNPKEHSMVERREAKEQQQHVKHPVQPSQFADAGSLIRDSAYATTSESEGGMGHFQAPSGLQSVTGGGQIVDQRGYPASVHNGVQGIGFEGRSAGPSGDANNGIPSGSGWGVHGVGGVDSRPGGGGPIGLLDHSRPPPQQQQQSGPQHPGALAPGLMYASTAARQAANLDPPLSHHQSAPWNSPVPGIDRRSQHTPYGDVGRRASQPGPLPTSPTPQHVDDPRDDSRLRGYHSHFEIRGFDTNATVSSYQHDGQDGYRRSDETTGSSQSTSQSQQLQSYTQHQQQQHQHQHQHQQLLQQQQHQSQLQPQRPLNPASSLGQQASLSMSSTVAPPATAATSSALWPSYRAPSPRNLVGTAGYGGHHSTVNDQSNQQRVLEPPVSLYPKGMGVTDVAHYPTTPTSHSAGSDYAWRDSSSRSEAFPPIAAFASPNVSEGNGSSGGGGVVHGNGFDTNSVSGGAMASSLDGRNTLQHQHQLQNPTDPSNSYWDRSFMSRGWAPGSVGMATMPPPPGRGPNTPDYQRAGGGENSIGAGSAMQSSDVSRSAMSASSSLSSSASAGWR